MAIDRMEWHYGSNDYPEGLPAENAGTHIGMYLAFVFSQGMAGEHIIKELSDLLEKLKRREITGFEFFDTYRGDEKFFAQDLDDDGEEFTIDYYHTSEFTKQFGEYFDDYCNVFSEYPSPYHVEDTWENFDRLKPILDKRLQQWRDWLNAG